MSHAWQVLCAILSWNWPAAHAAHANVAFEEAGAFVSRNLPALHAIHAEIATDHVFNCFCSMENVFKFGPVTLVTWGGEGGVGGRLPYQAARPMIFE